MKKYLAYLAIAHGLLCLCFSFGVSVHALLFTSQPLELQPPILTGVGIICVLAGVHMKEAS